MTDEQGAGNAMNDGVADDEAVLDAEVRELFDDYCAGFDDFDADGVADCFAYPAVIWQFGKGNVFADDEELLENIEKLFDALDKEGVVRSEYEVLSAHVGGDTGLVTLAWAQVDAADEPVLEFTCHYHLLFDGDTWRIAMIVNEP
ncbi:nuclear transport factor 2 family protein [Stappia sp.]|uniref:nuclear transport factor 2 family protein n=1 Tax=Stappia sp. TaxID=1870903 RepID=UPI0032D94B2E